MSSFRTRTVRALSWSFGSKIITQIISIIFGIVLARLLLPEDFGLVAMAMVMMGFAGLLADVGLGSALIQKKDATEDHFSSVFWANIGIGVVLTIALVQLSPLVAAFFNQPKLEEIVSLLSVNFIVGALAMVPTTRLSKQLAFREIALINFVGMSVSGGVAIVLAMKGYGYWSLVAQRLIERGLVTVLVWVVGRWTPKLRFDGKAFRELFGFGSYVFLTGSIRYAAVQADKLLIGKFLNATSLGLYDKAYSMMLFPLQNISHVIGQVMFPSLSQIQDDPTRVRDLYLRMTRAISLVTFPMMAGMFVVVDSFVLGVLGEKWIEIIPLFKIFCVVGFFVSIATVTGPIYQSLGRAKLQLKVNLVNQPIQIVGVVAGLYWGLQGVAIGFAITTIFGVFFTWWFVSSLLEIRIWRILSNLLPTLLLSLLMGCGVWLSSSLFLSFGALSNFILQLFVGVILYIVLLVIIKPLAYQDVLDVLMKQYGKNK